MARKTNQLTARFVDTTTELGMHSDGGGLYLRVAPGGSKQWIARFSFNGKRREMGLGSAGKGGLPLIDARNAARQAVLDARQGKDPIAARNAAREDAAATNAVAIQQVPTFDQCARDFLAAQDGSFTNRVHAEQWRMTLLGNGRKIGKSTDKRTRRPAPDYCGPIRHMPVDKITVSDVLKCLKPHWQTRSETASRVRGRIERVLDFAAVNGHRNGENPARFQGNLALMLPTRQKLTRGHHAAMPIAALPNFLCELRKSDGIAARALELLILTATRSGEVRGMRWREVDLEQGLWIIPAERMKAKKEHRIPLVDRAVEILRLMRWGGVLPGHANQADLEVLPAADPDTLVFPGAKSGKPMSDMTLLAVLKRMGQQQFTVHGFRSTFRDWAGDETEFPFDVVEAALAHQVGNATVRAYRRGDALDKRRKLLTAWASRIDPSPADSRVAKLFPV